MTITTRMIIGGMLRINRMFARDPSSRGLGVERFRQYLSENCAREDAWRRLTPLPPEVVIARASLSITDLMKAERIINKVVPRDQESEVWERIDLPTAQLFAGGLIERDEFSVVLPQTQLSVERCFVNQKLIVFPQITNEQYLAFVTQTGHRGPHYWGDDVFLRCDQADRPVVGVDLADCLCFAAWLGRDILTQEGLASVKAYLKFNRLAEWTKTMVEFEDLPAHIIYSSVEDAAFDDFDGFLVHSCRRSRNLFSSELTFRVVGSPGF